MQRRKKCPEEIGWFNLFTGVIQLVERKKNAGRRGICLCNLFIAHEKKSQRYYILSAIARFQSKLAHFNHFFFFLFTTRGVTFIQGQESNIETKFSLLLFGLLFVRYCNFSTSKVYVRRGQSTQKNWRKI